MEANPPLSDLSTVALNRLNEQLEQLAATHWIPVLSRVVGNFEGYLLALDGSEGNDSDHPATIISDTLEQLRSPPSDPEIAEAVAKAMIFAWGACDASMPARKWHPLAESFVEFCRNSTEQGGDPIPYITILSGIPVPVVTSWLLGQLVLEQPPRDVQSH